MKRFLTLIFGCFFLSFSAFAGEGLVGKQAPSLSGQNAFGNGLLRLSNLQMELSYEVDEKGNRILKDGKYIPKITNNIVVINFFSTTCIPCLREIPTYNQIAEEFKGKPVKLIFVNIDQGISNDEIIRFAIRRGIKVPLMLPNAKSTIKRYQVYSMPRIVVIDQKGIIAHQMVGFHDDFHQQLRLFIQAALKSQ